MEGNQNFVEPKTVQVVSTAFLNGTCDRVRPDNFNLIWFRK